MAQETTPNYPAMREADAKAKLDASAKRIERADRASVNRKKDSAKPVISEPVKKEYSRETSDTGNGRIDSPLSDRGTNSDNYYRTGPVKYVDQAPRTPDASNEAYYQFSMDSLRHDLSILGPLVEHFKSKYLNAMAVVIRTEDPNYDRANIMADPKLERPSEVVEASGRKEEEVRNSSPFAKDLFAKLDESLKQELIKLGVVGEGEGNVDKLFERTSKYVEKASEIVELDDKNRELQKTDSDNEMAKMERRLNRKEFSPTLAAELETAQAEVKKLEDNIEFMGNGDPEKLTQARFMVKDRLDAARAKVERIGTEIKNEKKEFVEKKAPEAGRENTNEEVTQNNKKIKQLQERLTKDSTQYNKYHVKNPDASWDSESKKVKVEESANTVTTSESSPLTAVVEPASVLTLEKHLAHVGEVLVKNAVREINREFNKANFVPTEPVIFSDETVKVENIFAILETAKSSLDREKSALNNLDRIIAQKRSELSKPVVDNIDEEVEESTEVNAVLVLNAAANAEPNADTEEIKSLVKRRESLATSVALSEAKWKALLAENKIPEDKQDEFMQMGKALSDATQLTVTLNAKIQYTKAEFSKADSELLKQLGLENDKDNAAINALKDEVLAKLQKDKDTAFASVADLTAKMNLIMGVTTTESAPDNGASGPLSIGGSGLSEPIIISGGSSTGPVVNAQAPNEGGAVAPAEAPKVVVPEKGRLAKYWDSVKSFIDKTVGKEAPKSQKISIFVAVGLIAAVLFGTRGFGAVKLAEDLVRKGPDQANKGPEPTPTNSGPLVSPLPTPTSTAKPEVVKEGNVTRVEPTIPAVEDFTQAITDIVGAPDVFINRTNPSWSQATPTPVPAASPSSVSAVVGEAPKISVAKLVPVEFKEGDSLSAKYHENGYFTEVTDWSHENAMPMVIQMLTDNIKNPEFWNRLLENSPELKNDPRFKGAVNRAQAANYSEADEKAIKSLLTEYFKFNDLTAEDLANKLGLNKPLTGSKWNIPVKIIK